MATESGSGSSSATAGLFIVVFIVIAAFSLVFLEGIISYVIAGLCVIGLVFFAAQLARRPRS